ncbi:hypothetical protein [Ilumatobacter sp.]|jgi:hypothetical protein|uniref:hypothetical protein n=1 Tax=Ilumatobacter sp. TaxID=1967498 RepID=UPI003752820B
MSGLDATERTDAHTALIHTRVGQAVVAVLVVVMSVWIVGPNLPASPARDMVAVVWSPAVNAGFEQNWSVFSPNPRAQTLEVVAVAEFADGTTTEWRLPEFGPVIGAYRTYRWRKWQERVRLDSNARYWDSSAAWIARDVARGDELPVRVRLLRRWRDLEPLTADGIADTKLNEFEFHVWVGAGG